MSHVGNGENDFADLEDYKFSPEILEKVKEARREAREVIDSIEPFHIMSRTELIYKLETALRNIKQRERIEIESRMPRIEGDALILLRAELRSHEFRGKIPSGSVR